MSSPAPTRVTPPPAGLRPGGQELRLGLLLVLALLAAFSPVATDLYLPGFEAMSQELGTTASGVQLTLTAMLVGMAVGQLVTGPLSDRYGRRGPLLASTAVCVAAGVVTAVAPTLTVLVVARFVQGAAGAGGVVIGRAVIADLVTGRAAARAFTLMVTVGGVAPILAPLAGSLLAGPVGWRGMMWAITALGVVSLVAVLAVVPETRPRVVRDQAGTSSYAAGLRRVFLSRPYWCDVATFSLSFAMMMAYIAASPFVYQNVLGLSEVGFAISFGINACGLIGAGWVASRVVERTEPRRLVAVCLAVQLASTATLALLTASGAPGWTYAMAIFVAVSTNGGVMGSTAALAMDHVREIAGTGSAWLGFSQFLLGAVVSPLVGLGGKSSAVVPALVMLVCSALACAAAASNRRLTAGAAAPVPAVQP